MERDMSKESMYKIGDFKDAENPWENETDLNAPFNKDFFIILNVAVGGTNLYFPNEMCNRVYENQPAEG